MFYALVLNAGVCLEHGFGVAKDEKQAVGWYQKAAAQNADAAQFALGMCARSRRAGAVLCPEACTRAGVQHGTGVAKDEKQAVEWYQKAAAQSYPHAQYNLGPDIPGVRLLLLSAGVCLERGFGVLKDEKQAVEWYRKAAAQNDAAAQFALGMCAPSPSLWRCASLRLCTLAGLCYRYGRGIAKDDKQAVEWYWKAAAQNNDNAQRALGLCEDKRPPLPPASSAT